MMRTELVWEGKYDKFGERREVDIAGRKFPLQPIETIDEPRSHAEAQEKLFNPDSAHRDDFRNKLIWGDNRLVMASLMSKFKGAIDLIYIDPPFDVGADFTLKAPIGDSRETIDKEQSILEMVAYRDIWGRGMDSYLGILSEQLTMMRDLLSEQGSIYVHCDWRIASIIRLCLNEIFGEKNFVNEIIWQGTTGDTSNKNKKFIKSHETILFYRKTNRILWNDIFQEYSEASLRLYCHYDEKGRYQLTDVGNPGGGGYKYDLGCGETPPSGGYRMPEETAREWLREDLLVVEKGKVPRRKRYIGEGVRCRDVWTDIRSTQGAEYLGYPTQKPRKLIERIITASSDEGSLVADFFCGSGTTAAVAEQLGRRWIASDLGRFAIHTTQKRLIGIQRELHNAKEKYRSFDVFNLGRYERQWWQQEALKGVNDEHRSIVLSFFRAEELCNTTPPPPTSHPLLHGRKGTAFVHVDGIDSILTRDEVSEVAKAVTAVGGKKVHCLAWDFEMDLRQAANNIEAELDIKIHLHRIPREIMEKNRTEIPPFFEMSLLEAEPVIQTKDKCVDIKLTKFIPSLTEVPSKELEQLQNRAVKNGFDFIDFWAIDFNWKKGKPFNHHWQDYRTRRDRSLKTISNAEFSYDKPGKHIACIKVVDVFGCDTSITVEIKT